MIRTGERVDNIIVITDGEQNAGIPYFEALYEYRRMVNPNARCFFIDVSGYLTAQVPENDELTHYIYGWSNEVLNYISMIASGKIQSMVEDIDRSEI